MNRLALRLAANARASSRVGQTISRNAAVASARWIQSRNAHTRIELPYKVEEGLGSFLPAESLKMIAEDYQQGLLDRLNEEVKGTEQWNKTVAQTVIDAAQDPSKTLMFNYASEALNNSFFLQSLKPLEAGKESHEADLESYLSSRIQYDFGSLEQLKSTFGAAALGMFGSGWVWLVCDQQGSLAVLPTFGTGTLLIQSQIRVQRKVDEPEFVVGESFASPASKGMPATPSSPASGTSHPPPTLNPSTQARAFSTSSRSSSAFNTAASSLHDTVSRPGMGNADVSRVGEQLFPLLCVSVHEHAWVGAGYGVWGKEEYLKRFWSVVNWKRVSEHYSKYVPDRRFD